MIDGFYFFCSQMSVPPSKILEFTDSLVKFSLRNDIISKEVLGRFLENLKKSIETNSKVYFERPKVLSENPSGSDFNPLIYKKYLNSSLIEFNQLSFKIDFRELLVNNLSFGNPIGCLMLIEAALEADDRAFEAPDLSEAFLYLVIFGVVNQSINPVVFRGLKRVFRKVQEDPQGGLYMDPQEDAGVGPVFDGVIRAEFWASHLYELSLQIEECRDLFFKAMNHYVLKHESFPQASRLIRRLVNWVLKGGQKKSLEQLYMIQSVNLLKHLDAAVKSVKNNEDAPFSGLFQQDSIKYLSKSIWNSVLFFTENYLARVKKFNQEKQLIAFLVKNEGDIDSWTSKDLEKGIVYLLRSILKQMATLEGNEKIGGLREGLLKGSEKQTASVLKSLDELVKAQMAH